MLITIWLIADVDVDYFKKLKCDVIYTVMEKGIEYLFACYKYYITIANQNKRNLLQN